MWKKEFLTPNAETCLSKSIKKILIVPILLSQYWTLLHCLPFSYCSSVFAIVKVTIAIGFFSHLLLLEATTIALAIVGREITIWTLDSNEE